MKKLIVGVALIAVMAGCLFAGETNNISNTVADRSGTVIS